MWMSSNIRTLTIVSNNNSNIIVEVPEEQILHPLFIALTHSLVLGEDLMSLDPEPEKLKLSEEEFNKLETINELSLCSICYDNKLLNIKLKCEHLFCKGCIKKWLTEKANTCPTCRTEI